jgi:hypothetical protein
MSAKGGNCQIDNFGTLTCQDPPKVPPLDFTRALYTPPPPPTPIAKNCTVDSNGKCIEAIKKPTVTSFTREGKVDWPNYAGALEVYTQGLESKIRALSTE